MSYPAADGAVLVAAAVQAAIRECASVRTIAAVAAAVAGKVVSATARPASRPATVPKVPTLDAQSDIDVFDDPAQLLEKLRSVRRAQRHRKKQRRREAKQAALDSPPDATIAQHNDADSPDASTAGQRAGTGEPLAAAPAPVLARSPAEDDCSICHTPQPGDLNLTQQNTAMPTDDASSCHTLAARLSPSVRLDEHSECNAGLDPQTSAGKSSFPGRGKGVSSSRRPKPYDSEEKKQQPAPFSPPGGRR